MGIVKWLFKNISGSIGKPSKLYVKLYNEALARRNNCENSQFNALTHVASMYVTSTQLLLKLKPTPIGEILEASKGSIALLCWVLICEDLQLVNSFWTGPNEFISATEAIYEIVKNEAKTSEKWTLSEFQTEGLVYLYQKRSENNLSISGCPINDMIK